MCPLRYYPMLRRSTEPTYLRFELVRFAREHGIKPAARHFSTTVKTVRKWLRRWEPGSLRGLEDRSRAPLHPRRGITAAQRRELSRSSASSLVGRGAHEARLRWRSRRRRSAHLARGGSVEEKRRKHKTKQCLREVKKMWRLFEQTCVDTKDLCDIPELWAQAQPWGCRATSTRRGRSRRAGITWPLRRNARWPTRSSSPRSSSLTSWVVG